MEGKFFGQSFHRVDTPLPIGREQGGVLGRLGAGDTSEHVGQPFIWVDAMDFARCHERVHLGQILSRGLRTRKQVVLPSHRHRSDGIFDGIVVNVEFCTLGIQ